MNYGPAGGRGFVGHGGRAAGRRVVPSGQRRQRAAGDLGLIRHLGQQDRGTDPAAVQHQIWKTDSSGTVTV